MHVVAAGVHHRLFPAVLVGHRRGGGVREAGPLAHREGVHVGAGHDHRAVSVGEDPDHAGAADALGDVVAAPPQGFRRLLRRAVLPQTEFGVPVQVLVEVLQVGADGAEAA